MRTPRLSLLVLVPLVSACELLGPLPGVTNPTASLTPPTITFQVATLARTPSQAQLTAYYCPEVVSVPFGGAAILCQGFFGARPPV